MEINKLREFLDSLSVEDKIGQLNQFASCFFEEEAVTTGPANYLGMTTEEGWKLGSVLSFFTAEKIRKMQEEHMKHSAIPLLFCADVIEGRHTIYPVPLAQGCSFSPELAEKLSRVSAKESADCGIHLTFSPMVDFVRDARWGRVVESYGEDAGLNALMGAATVKGYHADGLDREGSIGCCVKHFAAYGAPVGGRDYNDVFLPEQQLYEFYLPAYKACVDAGVDMVMSSFNTLNGIPVSADSKMLKKLLRDEWGFDGVLITDYNSLQLSEYDGVTQGVEAVTLKGAECGINIDMCSQGYFRVLPKLYEKGYVTDEQLDELVWPVLELKNKLGLFENPYRYLKEGGSDQETLEKHAKIVKEAIPKCSVLLKNEEKLLPLSKSQKVAFIGPYTETAQVISSWTLTEDGASTELIREAVKRLYSEVDSSFCIGSHMVEEKNRLRNEDFETLCDDEELLLEAVQKAKEADAAVLCIGEPSYYSGEARSRADIRIPAPQRKLFDAVHAVNPNVVVVLFTGRPLDITEISQKAKAILNVWRPGNMGAEPIVKMLFGEMVPSGKLSMSFPYSVGQVPVYYNPLPTAHLRLPAERFASNQYTYKSGYIDMPSTPLYPFGFGLSYTDFKYSDTKLSKSEIELGESLIATVAVTNTGNVDAEEIVQMYMRDPYAQISRPERELKGFKRVFLKAGETKEVSFEITPEQLYYYNSRLEKVTDPGEFRVKIAPSSSVNLSHVDENWNLREVGNDYVSFWLKEEIR